uniref:Uncharacterized protein n=1 Tax=Octopus bimaculoides TaxID=37653 RepID=A0A0L8GTQ2_OCTBM
MQGSLKTEQPHMYLYRISEETLVFQFILIIAAKPLLVSKNEDDISVSKPFSLSYRKTKSKEAFWANCQQTL